MGSAVFTALEWVTVLALATVSAQAQAFDCGPINLRTGQHCLHAGPITSEDNGSSGTLYHWHFDNSCSYGADIILGRTRPSVTPGGMTFTCDKPIDPHGLF